MAEVPPDERRTALLVEVPVEARVDDFRQRHLAATVARGLPAHVTVLFPFAAATDVDARLRAEVAEHFRTITAFTAELTRVDRFDAHVWLAPEPHERFIALLTETHARFPQFPPYGDAFAEPVPHLTIAEVGPGESVETSSSKQSTSSAPGSRSGSPSTASPSSRSSPTAPGSEVRQLRARMTGQFVRVSVRVPLALAEEARAAAIELAPGGFEESETGETLTLGLYVDESAVEAIRAAFADVDVTPVEPGWEDAWRAFHRPARAGGLWIGPPWEQPDPGEPAVVIDPGRAFGTGAHPTTRLCVELLAGSERGSLLDVGCGSGVLSIAAARLGFDPIRAVDNDPIAVETTIANAAVNDVVLEATVLDGESDELPTRRRRRRERAAQAGREDPRAARHAVRDHLGLPDGRHAGGAGLASPRARRARRLGGGSLRAERVAAEPGRPAEAGHRAGGRLRRKGPGDDRIHPVAWPSAPVPAPGIGTTGSPTRIVPPPRMSARSPPRCTSPRRMPGGREPLQVRARLGQAPADALDLPDQEAAADESVQPDPAGDDVAACLFPGDLDPVGSERLERLRLDQRQLVAAACPRERSLAAEVPVALEPMSRDRPSYLDPTERPFGCRSDQEAGDETARLGRLAVGHRYVEAELERRDHDALDEVTSTREQPAGIQQRP